MSEEKEKKMLERDAFMVLQKPLKVSFLHSGDKLGYTDGISKTVFIAWEHEYYKGFTHAETVYFRKGIFAHELLHQCFTNFKYDIKLMYSLKSGVERHVYRLFSNTLEDPAIEYFADSRLGEGLVDALRFTIREIYKKSPSIDEGETTPFTQLMNALIQFGDMGLVKGSFTYNEAKEYFKKIAPLYYKGIRTFNNKERLDIAVECMEASRPLWEKEFKSVKEFEQKLKELLKRLSKENATGNSLANADCGLNPDEDDNEDGQNDIDGSGKKRSGQDSNGSEAEVRRKAAAKELAEVLENDDEKAADDILKRIEASKKEADKKADEEIRPDMKKMSENAKKADSESGKLQDNFSDSEKVCKKMQIKNHTVSADPMSVTQYAKVKNALSSDINYLANSLKRLFEEDTDEYVPFTSGRYDVMRGSIGKTAKVFNKKRVPADRADMAVLLAVDNSGSMNDFNNIQNAVCAAVVIAEACEKMKIPVYIMGFTREPRQFVPWKHSKEQLSSLIKMRATGGTDDALAIKFAREIINRVNSEHKFVFVLSDGYGSPQEMKEEIKKTRKTADVFAVGLGNIGTEYFKNVYGQDFLHMKDTNGLAKELSKKLIKLVKRTGR